MSPHPQEGVATLRRLALIAFSIVAVVLVVAAAFASGASAGPQGADECELGLTTSRSLASYPMNSC